MPEKLPPTTVAFVTRPVLPEKTIRTFAVPCWPAPHDETAPETLFDGVTFDPAKPEDYAKSFAVHNLKG